MAPSTAQAPLLSPAALEALEEGERHYRVKYGSWGPGTLRIKLDGSLLLEMAIDAGDVVGATVSAGDQLLIWHMPLRRGKRAQEKPTRGVCTTLPIGMATPAEAAAAAAAVRQLCCWWGRAAAPRVLVIINPASGPGKAPQLYEQQVKPLLAAAGWEVTTYTTRAPKHASEIVQEVAPGSMDVIAAMALWDLPTAVHAIVKGRSQTLDIASVVQPPGTRTFAFLSISYGLITNLDIGTEHLRCLGGTRFVVGALWQIILNKSHHCHVAVVEADAECSSAAASAATTLGSSATEADSVASVNGSRDSAQQQQQQQQQQSAAQAAGGSSPAHGGPPLQHIGRFLVEGAGHAELAEGRLPPLWRMLPEDEVQLFTACNLPRLDMNFHLAPDAGLHTGNLNLIYTNGRSRAQGLELLIASETGQHMHLVQQRRVAALAIEPLSSGTWLVVDGEVVPFRTLYAEVHPGLCCCITAPAPVPHS
eukprot:scaffold4.g4943.t1